MKKQTTCMVLLCAFLWLPLQLPASNDYSDHRQLTERLEALAGANPALASLESLTTTVGGKEIWLLSVGSGELTQRPAVAVVGGVSGDRLLGSELAISFAERLLDESGRDEVRQLLDSVTFYIFPDMSPDARAQYFAPLKYERFGNANPSDLDRDGRVGEDPYNDLNGDGMITMMRVEDPTGKWMKHPDDSRVMVKARVEKGERGGYRLLSEGIDEDQDGQWNEDGEEGVFFNRNFTYDYPAFSRGAGEHAVSEKETRAIADFLFEAKNVFAVISLGEADNLSHPLSYDPRKTSGRIISGWLEEDVKINQMVSHIYRSHLDVSDAEQVAGSPGDFFQWAYFHYGRFSFSTPGWWIPDAGEEDPSFGSKELNFLRWAEGKGMQDVFVPWEPVDHPDFPGRKVEVGGIVPFAMTTPPYHMVDSLLEGHYHFINEVARLRPQIDVLNLQKEELGRNLYRITADIANLGSFPATSQLGQRVRWVQKPVVRVELADGQKMMSGRTIDIIQSLEGHSSLERSWVVQGGGTLVLRAGSECAGFREIEITL